MTEDFPRVVDEGSVIARLKRVERAMRTLRWLMLATAAALAIVGVAVGVYAWSVANDRTERFCTLARQTIIASSPEAPVDPFLVALHAQNGCAPLPPGVRPYVQSSAQGA